MAQDRGALTLTTEFLLWGLLKEGHGIAAHALQALGITEEKLQSVIERIRPSRPDKAAKNKVAVGPVINQVSDAALQEALKEERHYIGTEHVLLALMTICKGDISSARHALDDLGVAPAQVIDKVNELLGTGARSTYSPSAFHGAIGFARSLETALTEAGCSYDSNLGAMTIAQFMFRYGPAGIRLVYAPDETPQEKASAEPK